MYVTIAVAVQALPARVGGGAQVQGAGLVVEPQAVLEAQPLPGGRVGQQRVQRSAARPQRTGARWRAAASGGGGAGVGDGALGAAVVEEADAGAAGDRPQALGAGQEGGGARQLLGAELVADVVVR